MSTTGSDDSSDDEDDLRATEELLADASTTLVGLRKRNARAEEEYESFCKRQRLAVQQTTEQTIKFRNKDYVMFSLNESLDYVSILTRLMRNDEDTRVVNSTKFPIGHGQALGAALRHNTAVQQLELNLGRCLVLELDYSAKYEMTELLKFFAESTSLVDVRVDSPLTSKTPPTR